MQFSSRWTSKPTLWLHMELSNQNCPCCMREHLLSTAIWQKRRSNKAKVRPDFVNQSLSDLGFVPRLSFGGILCLSASTKEDCYRYATHAWNVRVKLRQSNIPNSKVIRLWIYFPPWIHHHQFGPSWIVLPYPVVSIASAAPSDLRNESCILFNAFSKVPKD